MESVIILLVGLCALLLLREYQRSEERLKSMERRIAKLERANKNNLPFRTAEEIEHAKAGLILLQNELDFKQSLVDNISAHLDMARENKRSG